MSEKENRENVTSLKKDGTMKSRFLRSIRKMAERTGQAIDNSAAYKFVKSLGRGIAEDAGKTWYDLNDFGRDVRDLGGAMLDTAPGRAAKAVGRGIAEDAGKTWYDLNDFGRDVRDLGGAAKDFGKEKVKRGKLRFNWLVRKAKRGWNWLRNTKVAEAAKPVENSAQMAVRPQENSDMLKSAILRVEAKKQANISILPNASKTDWMAKYDVENNDMVQKRLKSYMRGTKQREGDQNHEIGLAIALESSLILPRAEGGLGIDPKTPEGQEAIIGLKTQMYEKYGVKSFEPDKPKTQSQKLNVNVAARTRSNVCKKSR